MSVKNKTQFAPMPGTPQTSLTGGDILLRAAPKLFLLTEGALDENKMSGEASGIGNLDCYQDVIFPEAFTDEVLADFLQNGFIAEGHDWTKMIGMPMVAVVKGNRLYTECEFHSTPDAQAVKIKCQERLDKGKTVGLSIGFGMYPASYKDFATGAALLAFAKTQGYDMSLFDEEGIKACTTKCRAILHIDKLYEYSPVPVPANPAAWALAVKAAMGEVGGTLQSEGLMGGLELSSLALQMGQSGELVVKSNYLGPYVESSMTMAALSRLTDYLYSWGFYDAVYYSDQPKAERRERLLGCLMEYSTYVLKVFDALISDDADDEEVSQALAYIKTFWPKPDETNASELSLRAGERFAQTSDTALAAVQGLTQRAQTIVEMRRKEGRSLSPANTERLTAQRDELQACLSTIDSLLAAPSLPSEVDTDATATVDLPGLHAKNRERNTFLRLLEVEMDS